MEHKNEHYLFYCVPNVALKITIIKWSATVASPAYLAKEPVKSMGGQDYLAAPNSLSRSLFFGPVLKNSFYVIWPRVNILIDDMRKTKRLDSDRHSSFGSMNRLNAFSVRLWWRSRCHDQDIEKQQVLFSNEHSVTNYTDILDLLWLLYNILNYDNNTLTHRKDFRDN